MITTTTITTCDICERADAMELRFAVGGKELTVDVCDAHRQAWNAAVGPFIAAARRPGRRVDHAVRVHGHR